MRIRKITLRMAIAIFTLLVGLAITASWLFWRQSPKLEEPPCRSCDEIYKARNPDLKTVTVVQLISNPEQYQDQIVQVRGILSYCDARDKGLFDSEGEGAGIRLFDQVNDSPTNSCSDVDKLLQDRTSKCQGKGISVKVLAVGRLSGFDKMRPSNQANIQFTPLCIQRADKVKMD